MIISFLINIQNIEIGIASGGSISSVYRSGG
jgi:hypothetical protein